MNANVVSRLVAAIGIIALPVIAAHAGHGQGGGPSQVPGFACYLVQGSDTGFVVDLQGIDDLLFDASFADRTNVHVGKAQLLCLSVMVTLDSRPDDNEGFNLPPGTQAPALKCYNTIATANNPAVKVDVTDSVDAGTFALQSAKYVCVYGTPTTPQGP